MTRAGTAGRRSSALAAALWLSAAGGALAAQDDVPGRVDPPSTVLFHLEEPSPNPFLEEVEIPFVLGEGPEPRWWSSVLSVPAGEGDGAVVVQPDRATVSLRVYNLLHQHVAWARIAPAAPRAGRPMRDVDFAVPGRYRAVWDGRADDGARVPPGPYFVEIVVEGWTAVRRVLRTR